MEDPIPSCCRVAPPLPAGRFNAPNAISAVQKRRAYCGLPRVPTPVCACIALPSLHGRFEAGSALSASQRSKERQQGLTLRTSGVQSHGVRIPEACMLPDMSPFLHLVAGSGTEMRPLLLGGTGRGSRAERCGPEARLQRLG